MVFFSSQRRELLTCPVPGCNAVIFDGTAVGPRSNLIPPEEQYDPYLMETNGQVRVVGSRINRQIVTNAHAQALLDKLSKTTRGVGKVSTKCLKSQEGEQLFHFLDDGTDLEKALGQFLSKIMIKEDTNLSVPDYCETLVNEISLQYLTVNGFLQLTSPRDRNLFQHVASMTNPQSNSVVMSQFCKAAPVLGNVLAKLGKESVASFQNFLTKLYQLYEASVRTETWFEETVPVPPSPSVKYVITGRDRVRLSRKYVQSEAEAARELKGIGDCKKIPTSTLHHSNLFVGCCPHGLGLIAFPMSSSESPRFPVNSLVEYWKIPPKYVIYDNSCHAHEFALNREPSFFKNTHFLVDKFHWRNHTACSRGYNSRLYPEAAKLNSQVCEQFNALLRKVALSAQYSNVRSYFLLVTSFILHHNEKIHRKFKNMV